MQRDTEAKYEQCAVKNSEITVILNQTDDNEEPKQILNLSTQAVHSDRRNWRNNAHQEKSNADK